MVAIYVQRTWLKTIGDVADLLLTVEHDGEHISFLAAKIEVNFPFLEAEIAKKEVTGTHDVFLPALIPVNVVSGIFDLTKKE
jgi:hypothetical protein